MSLALLSIPLGVAGVLITSLIFAHYSCAYGRSQWDTITTRGEHMAHTSCHASAGKSIISWRPLTTSERDEYVRRGAIGAVSIVSGIGRPPPWSSFWDDAAFAEALSQTRGAAIHDDIAVGWPARAFTCARAPDASLDPPVPVIRGGLELAIMNANRGTGSLLTEIRAVPLQPIWWGFLLDVAVFAVISMGIMLLFRAWLARRPASKAVERSTNAHRAVERGRSWGPLAVASLAFILLGLLTTAVVALLLPLLVRQRSIDLHSTTDVWCSERVDLLWTERLIRLGETATLPVSLQEAIELDRQLGAQSYTGIAREAAFSQLSEQEKLVALAAAMNRGSYTSTRTGWPVSCQWGARARDARGGTRPTWHLVEVKPMNSVASILNRGVPFLPTRPVWSGWLINTLFFAVCWLGVAFFVRTARRRRRARHGLCPSCAYDLKATPADAPCPECGHGAPR